MLLGCRDYLGLLGADRGNRMPRYFEFFSSLPECWHPRLIVGHIDGTPRVYLEIRAQPSE